MGGGVVDAAAVEGLASPGMGMRHYAPRARLVLVEGQSAMVEEVAKYSAEEVGVMLPDGWDAGGAGVVFRWGPCGMRQRLWRGWCSLGCGCWMSAG